ncbi:hypothetical protein PLICRDRAFT_499943 [Plicaturopsis crispa FD-325 SS-3]|nr:hypothetical protein PLICRDRAFT_499943 [Plicaturopsis crispa FD-325 SS-3]
MVQNLPRRPQCHGREKRWLVGRTRRDMRSKPGKGSLRGRGNDHAEARKAKLRQDGSLADEDTPKQSEQQQRQAEKARRKDAEAKQETSPRPQGTQSSSSESSSASTSSTGSQSLNSTPSTSFAGSESSFGTGTQRAQYEGSATSARLDEVERQELEKHIVAAAELAVSRFRSSLNPIMRGQKHMPSDSNPVLEGIYHNLVEVIENKLGDVACLSSEQHFSVNAFRDCARPMLHMDIASALVWRHECRVHLLEMCPPLGLPLDHESVRDALYRDESHIALVLENILASEVQKGKVLNMANEEAEKFVDAVEEVLVAIPHARDSISTLLHKAHRFMTEVAESCGIIPTALKITGVEVHGSHPVFRGGYADLFKGDHCGTVVMLKRLHSRLELRDEAGTKRSRRVRSSISVD